MTDDVSRDEGQVWPNETFVNGKDDKENSSQSRQDLIAIGEDQLCRNVLQQGDQTEQAGNQRCCADGVQPDQLLP